MNSLFVACLSFFFVSFAVAADRRPTFCTDDVSKCQKVAPSKVNITCVAPKTGSSCIKDVMNGDADFTLATANNMVDNSGSLTIIQSLKFKNIENYVQYYGLAVVKKGTTFNFTQLKGENSCHTGVGKTVGWVIPVGYLLYTKEMTYTDNQYKSVADFFGKSCAPGIGGISKASQAVKDELCSLCTGNCTTDGPFAGYEGAFKCMADGNKDRVGFVKQDTAGKVLGSGSGPYGNMADYRLLCTDGTSQTLDKYKDCNIGTRPASALVTGKGNSVGTINAIRSILQNANTTDLINGGIVDSKTEDLVDYSGTVEKYVEPYAKYKNALVMNVPDSAASSILATFALQFVAILAFAFQS
ncbi:serotransferrin-like [Dendronephthya gigantea]|uniref:serotransferrin-like n=1 Tax=Dendronephthya gigantea TaxID=151771 RepID=UPI00106B7E63|nr:serotransferrin-like [Dendronephthya gigantea]